MLREVKITGEDCGSQEGIEFLLNETKESSLYGRTLVKSVNYKGCYLPEGRCLSYQDVRLMIEQEVPLVILRSPI